MVRRGVEKKGVGVEKTGLAGIVGGGDTFLWSLLFHY